MPADWERPEEPEFPAGADLYWRCWRDLDDDRLVVAGGMGPPLPGRIGWLAIDRWARRHGITGGQFELLVRVIREMDGVLLERQRRGKT